MPNSHLYYTANAITFVSKWRLQGLFKSVIKLPFSRCFVHCGNVGLKYRAFAIGTLKVSRYSFAQRGFYRKVFLTHVLDSPGDKIICLGLTWGQTKTVTSKKVFH